MSEKQILAKLQHPFIVNMSDPLHIAWLSCVRGLPSPTSMLRRFGSFHDPRYIYMVLEPEAKMCGDWLRCKPFQVEVVRKTQVHRWR